MDHIFSHPQILNPWQYIGMVADLKTELYPCRTCFQIPQTNLQSINQSFRFYSAQKIPRPTGRSIGIYCWTQSTTATAVRKLEGRKEGRTDVRAVECRSADQALIDPLDRTD